MRDPFRRRLLGIGLAAGLLVVLLLAAVPYLALAAPPAQSPTDGQQLFQTKCTGCHTIGGGKTVGPDLKGVTDRRTRDWLSRWILDPPALVAQGDPTGVQLVAQYKIQMSNMKLTPDQVSALIDYLATQSGANAPAQPAGPPLLAGSAARGASLFMGQTGFQNGGPSCSACHTAAGIQSPGGGTLGPDLTLAFKKYGEQGLANFLNTYPLPTMNAVWTKNPLTPQEQADLRVFLQQAATAGQPPDALWQIAILAIAGCVALIGLAQFYWRKRLLGVRKPLIARMRRV